MSFQKRTVKRREDYSKALQRENLSRIKEVLSDTRLHIVDQIKDEYSAAFCENIKDLLVSKYGVEPSIGKRITKDALNIMVIHNAEYYDGVNDPHDQQRKGIAVQHITFEDFYNSSEFAISTVVHEIMIKKDLQDKRISLFDWEKLGLTETISFGMEAEIDETNRYFFMNIRPDGSFNIKEQELTLFEYNEYTEMTEVFEE